MSRFVIFSAGFFVLLLAAAGWRINESLQSPEVLVEARTRPIQAAPLCPWRDPDGDLKALFPNATRYEPDTLILSGLRSEVAERLGRTPTGDENVLRLYRIYREQTALGSVLPHRVKGGFGAIELVLAVGMDGQVRGLRLQRFREPEAIARALQNPDWLRSFAGRSAGSSWKLGDDIPEVPEQGRVSAEAMFDGVRTLLILLDTASQARSTSPVAGRHH